MTLMSAYIDILKKSTDPVLITEEFGQTFDQFERNIRIVTVHKEVAKKLRLEKRRFGGWRRCYSRFSIPGTSVCLALACRASSGTLPARAK
jgi:hypothetical protein